MKLAIVSWLCACACVLAACTTFDPIERGVCGNGILEPGEDCDSTAASCVRCAVTCTVNADCPGADYRCGVDGMCHAPGGELGSPVAAGPFEVDELAITDIDHDGTGDVLGISNTSLVVRHGDPSGRLAAVDSVVTPSQTGPAGLGDLDGDGSIDVALSTTDGIVAYTSQFRALAPLAVQSQIIGRAGSMSLDLRALFQFSATRVLTIPVVSLGGFVADDQHRVYLMVTDLNDPNRTLIDAPCVLRNGFIQDSAFSQANIETYKVHEDSGSADWVIALTAGTKLCVMAVHKDTFGTAQAFDITPANAVAPMHRPVLADLDSDADRCPSLVNTDAPVSAPRAWDGQTVGGHCTFKAASGQGDPLPAIGAGAAAVIVDHIPLDPPIPGVASDVLVLTDGVYAFVTFNNTFTSLYHASGKLARAAAADLTGDGRVDAVLMRAEDDDLDMLVRVITPDGINSYQLVRLDTASQVTTVTLGDYDGNGLVDIAYTEQVVGYQRLMVAFSTPDRPLAPVQLGAFPANVSVARVTFPDSVDQNSIADDLAVLQPGSAMRKSTLAILHGSPQRTLLPYFDPRPSSSDAVLRTAQIGQFTPSAQGADQPDLLAIGTSADTAHAWLVPGSTTGIDGTPNAGVAISGLPGVRDSTYLTWPLRDHQDVVIAVDHGAPARASVIDPWASPGAVVVTAASAISTKAPANAVVRSLHAADLDGDGAPELILSFAPPRGSSGVGAVLVCAMTGTMPHDCEDVVPAIVAAAPDTKACVDAVPARLGGAALALVVVCHGDGTTLYRVDRAGGTVTALAHAAASYGSIRAGDVTGDGVDDLVVLAGDSGVQSLVVYPQCTSRTLATCAHSSAGGSP